MSVFNVNLYKYLHLLGHVDSGTNLKKNELIECNHMCRCRVIVRHQTWLPSEV